MRRHPALRDLSSEHHSGLVLARRARKSARGGGTPRSAGWDEVRERFRSELDGHFRREEQGLLPALQAAGEVALVQRTLDEHQFLRAMIAEDRPENLAPFAEFLVAHIRFEETELFDAAQRLLDPEVLAQMERVASDTPRSIRGPSGTRDGSRGSVF